MVGKSFSQIGHTLGGIPPCLDMPLLLLGFLECRSWMVLDCLGTSGVAQAWQEQEAEQSLPPWAAPLQAIAASLVLNLRNLFCFRSKGHTCSHAVTDVHRSLPEIC